MTQKDIEWAAAIDILSFMQKHELDDEEMGSLICWVLDLADNEDFVEIFVAGGRQYGWMNHIRNIANEEHDDAN